MNFLKLLKHLIIIPLLILISVKISNKTAVAQKQQTEQSLGSPSTQANWSNSCNIVSTEEYGYFAKDHTQTSNRLNNDQIVNKVICHPSSSPPPPPPPPPPPGSGL